MRARWEWDLLERGAEHAAVAGALGDAAEGRGGLLVVEGPAGIGKTRLLGAARAAAVDAGFGVASARGTELERDFAFGVVRQLFEPLLTQAGAVRREELWAGPAAQAREVLTSVGAGPAGDLAVLHGLFWLTANACQDRPLVLVADDLQWCDVPSLRFLAFLLPRLADLGVLVVAGLRTGEPAGDERLVHQIITDPVTVPLWPQPLSLHATGQLLAEVLPGDVNAEFAAACHAASGGNPLLLAELARTLVAEGLAPTAANAGRAGGLGPAGVARLVAARLARLPQSAVGLARAVSVLGDGAELTTAAALAGQGTAAALEGATALERVEIVRIGGQDGVRLLSFVHPLVQAAVYQTLDIAEQTGAHRRAATLLAAAGANPERVAAHLLHVPPEGNPGTVVVLRAAAAAAASRGAPEGACTYLRRALAEPPGADKRLLVLIAAGEAALPVDLPEAAGLLQRAFGELTDPAQRADIAALLSNAYSFLGAPDEELVVLCDALDQLPATEQDRTHRLQAALVTTVTWFAPGRTDLLDKVREALRLPAHDSIGGRLLQCAVAGREMMLGDPAAVPRVRRALSDGSLVEFAGGDPSLQVGLSILASADDPMMTSLLDAAVRHAHLHGSRLALNPAYWVRAQYSLNRGQLADAEHDVLEAGRMARLANFKLFEHACDPLLAEILSEQGRITEAERILRELTMTPTGDMPDGPAYQTLAAIVQLHALRGDHQATVQSAERAQAALRDFDIRNHADLDGGVRIYSTLALHALGRAEEAEALATEDLAMARQWGVARQLGRALRVSGLVTGGEEGLALLDEAVTVLQDSPARLEHAKALTELGAALRRAGQRTQARPPLRQALDLAARCGANPVAERARTELVAAGGRPRNITITGPDALTPSERRIADLAASGATNRQIAQRLYVTPKTVEVHLSAVYRKLSITTRTQLSTALA